MTFDEFIQDGLGKANKLFEKLAQSGPNAVKTRERLFSDLKAELSYLGRFERNHLIPALGDQRKTRPLVKALEKDSQKVAELLVELEGAPRAGDAFLLKLADLQSAFQAHVRDERKALLPAVLDALHRAQTAELEAAETAAQKAEAAKGHADAEAKPAEEAPRPIESSPAVQSEVVAAPAPAPPAPEPITVVEAQPEPTARANEPVTVPVPLAAITILHTLAPAFTPPASTAGEPPSSLGIPLPSPVFGAHAWTSLMQEAAAGAMMGYRLMLAYSNNAGFAALQTRLMKDQIELMTQSSYKMIEAAQRFTRAGKPG